MGLCNKRTPNKRQGLYMKVFALNPTPPKRAKGKKMAKKKATTRRRRKKAPAKRAATKAAPKRRRRRRASTASAAAPKRRRRSASSAKPKRRRTRRRSNPSVKGFSDGLALSGFGALGILASALGGFGGQALAGFAPGNIGVFLTNPLAGSSSSDVMGSAWSPAQYIGATLAAWQAPKLLPRRTKPAHVMAFRVGSAVLPGAKALWTEVFPRVLPATIRNMLPSALGATVGYDANGQAWLKQGNSYVAMQGMGSMLYEAGPLDGMGELVASGPYDSAGWLHSGSTQNVAPENTEEEGMAGF